GQEEIAIDKEKREELVVDSLNLLLKFLLIVILNPLSTLFGTLNSLAISSSRWHSTLSTVLGSARFHLPVVGGIGTFGPSAVSVLPPLQKPNPTSPLASHAAMLKSSISLSVGRAMRATIPSTTSASRFTTSSATSPSPQVQNTRFRLRKSSTTES
ncbi:unnamed protein product, partial [Musa textilis]